MNHIICLFYSHRRCLIYVFVHFIITLYMFIIFCHSELFNMSITRWCGIVRRPYNIIIILPFRSVVLTGSTLLVLRALITVVQFYNFNYTFFCACAQITYTIFYYNIFMWARIATFLFPNRVIIFIFLWIFRCVCQLYYLYGL